MPLDPFYMKTDPEIKKMINEWFFEELEHLERLRILLRIYEKLNVTKVEEQGVATLWRKIDFEGKKDIYRQAWQYQWLPGRR